MADLDEQLITAARAGDLNALTTLVADSHPTVRRFARTLCSTPEDAEDAAQEALIILYRKIGMLRATSALTSWMFRIVRNECLRRARQLLREHPIAPETTTPSAEDEVLRQLEAQAVAAAIADLPPDQRSVLVLRDVQGYSGPTVAKSLGLNIPAMKSRLHRARTTVRVSLGGES
ncbi:RNA polymerase sigma factor [Kribbella sp. NPDC000426]|uniref:RNA polymerase sigma factor n=1 Tax=Kribbella sp. NPDC000426 TaxID=3154255 RepID=UPI00331E3549